MIRATIRRLELLPHSLNIPIWRHDLLPYCSITSIRIWEVILNCLKTAIRRRNYTPNRTTPQRLPTSTNSTQKKHRRKTTWNMSLTNSSDIKWLLTRRYAKNIGTFTTSFIILCTLRPTYQHTPLQGIGALGCKYSGNSFSRRGRLLLNYRKGRARISNEDISPQQQ